MKAFTKTSVLVSLNQKDRPASSKDRFGNFFFVNARSKCIKMIAFLYGKNYSLSHQCKLLLFYCILSSVDVIMDKLMEIETVLCVGLLTASYLTETNRVGAAIDLLKECLIFLENNAQKNAGAYYMYTVRLSYEAVYIVMYTALWRTDHLKRSIECGRKLQTLLRESGKKRKGGWVTLQLGALHERQHKYQDAKELYLEALGIMTETGDAKGELFCSITLGKLLASLCEFAKARPYLEKALAIAERIGDREREEVCHACLGRVFEGLDEHDKAEECYKRAHNYAKLVGNHSNEATYYEDLGNVFESRGQLSKAKEFYEKALTKRREMGDKEGEANCFTRLGTVFRSVHDLVKAKKCFEKALVIAKEMGDKKGEAINSEHLGTVYKSLRKFSKAKEFYEQAVAVWQESGNRTEAAASYRRLGDVLDSLADHASAIKCYQKARAVSLETGNLMEASVICIKIAEACQSLREFATAKEYSEKALAIAVTTGDRKTEASCYESLGSVFNSLHEFHKASEYYKKALAIAREIGDRTGEARVSYFLGCMFAGLFEFRMAKEYTQNALLHFKEMDDSLKEAYCYINLAITCYYLGEFSEAEEYYEKSLVFSCKAGDIESEVAGHANWSLIKLLEGNIHEAESLLSASVSGHEEILNAMGGNEHFKMSFLDGKVDVYRAFSQFHRLKGSFAKALQIEERARSRALVDLLSTHYSVENQTSTSAQAYVDVHEIVNNESNSVFLYISYLKNILFTWNLRADKPIRYRQINIGEYLDCEFSSRSVDEVLSNETWGEVLVGNRCEDRSWFPSDACNSSWIRFSREEKEQKEHQPSAPTLADCYKMIIAPVVDLLVEPEIIVVPDRVFFKVPFAALQEENGKYLSESFRIRIVPSLTTLKLIHDSPADYHSQTGALIVGDPEVGSVLFKERIEKVSRLPSASEEAEMIGKLLGIQPLLGKQATKQAILESMNSVSLIHIAAHGDAERGEIVLAPPPAINRTPEEEDYLLTMAEISQVRLRAKLVVLSCCYSAKGQIRAEGIVGIARAFLGSGARSVLVALWAIDDEATFQFMSRFYEHLVHGESASESLHQAMKWMRENGYSKVGQWAPFMLIGDNVTFEFGAKGWYQSVIYLTYCQFDALPSTRAPFSMSGPRQVEVC